MQNNRNYDISEKVIHEGKIFTKTKHSKNRVNTVKQKKAVNIIRGGVFETVTLT